MRPIANLWLRKKLAASDAAQKTHEISEPRDVPVHVEPAPVAAPTPVAHDEVVFFLGDFLPRIAARFLKHGEHDPKREVRFKTSELTEMIATRKTKVSLARIAEACPEIFRDGENLSEASIYFPWRKLAELMERIKPGTDGIETSAPADLPARDEAALPTHARQPAALSSKRLASPAQSVELLRRQRDLAVQQRDQALSRLKSVEEKSQRQIAIVTAQRDLAISEKADALAFIEMLSQIRATDPVE